MNHFDITQWTDFARGVAASADRAAMTAHINAGCRRCRTLLDLVQRVVDITRGEAGNNPPDDVVRWAKALGALRRSPRSGLVPQLVYNSLADPAFAGIRSGDRVSHQALYEVGNVSVDLRLEHEQGSPRVRLLGQLSDRAQPARMMARTPILLMTREAIVAQAVSNRFGEFEMEYVPVRHLWLRLPLDPEGRLDLPLNPLRAESLLRSGVPSRPGTLRRLQLPSSRRLGKKKKPIE